MPSLVTRFHLLLFGVTLAIAGVALIHVPEGYVFVAHWHGSTADWAWPRDIALAVAPLVELALMGGFWLLGRRLSNKHLADTRHILDPALTLALAVATACQFALLMQGVGSDLDFFRATAFVLAGVLLVLAAVLFEAERHTYRGLRLPWPIASDRAWRLVHRLTGLSCAALACLLIWLGWIDAGAGPLVLAMGLSLLAIPLLGAVFTLLARRL